MRKQDSFSRYSRQIFIEEIGVAGQRKIAQARVLVIGVGGLGSPVLQYLAAAGVGTLAAVDFDVVEVHNLNRQVIHSVSYIGKHKVASAADYIAALNGDIRFIPICRKIDRENVQRILRDYDIVVDGSDNFTTRYLVNDACVALGKPLVYGSIFAFEGQLAVFNFLGSKNLRDIFPEAPAPEDRPNCDQNGVLGPLPGMIGSMMAMSALKIITDLPVTANQLTVVDALHGQFTQVNF